MTGPARPRLSALTSIRFLAAFHIVLFHIGAMRGLHWAPPGLRAFAGVGYVAVTLFFILSGFVLVYTYADRALDLRQFWKARLARLYPVYLLALVLSLPSFLWMAAHPSLVPGLGLEWTSEHLALTMTLVLTMMQSWVPQAAMGWNAVAWAVSTEIAFYAAFPFLLRRLLRAPGRGLWLVGGLSWLVSLSLTIAYVKIAPDHVVATSELCLPWLNALKFHPLARLPEFVAGVACGCWFVRGGHSSRLATPLVLGGAVATLVTFACSGQIPYPVLHTGLLTPAFAAIVCGVALRPRWLSVLESRWLTLLGESSYALYLLHGLFIGAFFYASGDPTQVPTFGKALGATVAAVVFALLVLRFVEEPARRWLRYGSRRSQTSAAGKE